MLRNEGGTQHAIREGGTEMGCSAWLKSVPPPSKLDTSFRAMTYEKQLSS